MLFICEKIRVLFYLWNIYALQVKMAINRIAFAMHVFLFNLK